MKENIKFCLQCLIYIEKRKNQWRCPNCGLLKEYNRINIKKFTSK